MPMQNQRRVPSSVHSSGTPVVAEIRDRKEEYDQPENPACNGDYFLWLIVLSRYTFKQYMTLTQRRKYLQVRVEMVPLGEHQQTGPSQKGQMCPQSSQTVPRSTPVRTCEQQEPRAEPQHPLLPFSLSYTCSDSALSFHFKDFAYHIFLALMVLAFYQGQPASNILESNYLKICR